ncbi:histidine kinase [Massilia solisilvae]|uniref:histidine kinase n=1 Tax=Massilia solisilvae TaxID=1811225 RepID=A0ABT2BH59_9BURK|nr:histidine kinase [Massilia solisilvae]MCS0607777.1 histidine kinase [Massilia solisilvae]
MNRFPFKRLALDGAYSLVLTLMCAMVIWALNPHPGFLTNLVYSLSIGGIAFLVSDITRLLLWGEHRIPNWWLFALLIGASVVVAQVAGTALAASIMGHPVDVRHSLTRSGGLMFTTLAMLGATVFFIGREGLLRARAAAASERARAEAVERQAVQAQLQLLQAQLEPHMLFNTLANVQGLIAIDSARAQHMLDQLIQFLRATLTASRAESTTLAREFALAEAYLGLMAVRMGARLAYSLDLPAELAQASLPPMLLQPLVENAIAHGLEPQPDGGAIAVRARREGSLLILSVEDTGRGIDAPPVKPGTRLGLANTRDRLRAVYGERASLSLQAAMPAGALATITLPA